jgi:hypothetical protein
MALLLGNTGAAVGAISGRKTTDTNINTTTKETKKTKLTVELVFNDGPIMNVFVISINPYHWLISFASQEPMSDADVELEKELAVQLDTKYDEEKKQEFINWELIKRAKMDDAYLIETYNAHIKISVFSILLCVIGPILVAFYNWWAFGIISIVAVLLINLNPV